MEDLDNEIGVDNQSVRGVLNCTALAGDITSVRSAYLLDSKREYAVKGRRVRTEGSAIVFQRTIFPKRQSKGCQNRRTTRFRIDWVEIERERESLSEK